MTDALMLVLRGAQPVLMLWLAVICLRLLWELDYSGRARRGANPAMRYGLCGVALAGLGRGAQQLRAVLDQHGGEQARPWLLMHDPDVLGELMGLGVAIVAVVSAMFLVRGCRAVLFRDASGEVTMPPALRRLLPVLLAGVVVAGWVAR